MSDGDSLERVDLLITGHPEGQFKATDKIIENIEGRFGDSVEIEIAGAVAGEVETVIHILAGAATSVAAQEVYCYLKDQYEADDFKEEDQDFENRQMVTLHLDIESEEAEIVRQANEKGKRASKNRPLSEFAESDGCDEAQ